MKGLTVLGSTGSIGLSTLDVMTRHPERYRVVALTANRDVDGLLGQCLSFKPQIAVMADATSAAELAKRLAENGSDVEVLSGVAGLEQVAAMPEADYVMAAIVGAAGLLPAMAAVRAGKRVLLANKEALVVSGRLFMEAAEAHEAEILPIDSEHNAVFQCMPADFQRGLEQVGVRKILLTASGGPFRTMPLEGLKAVTPEQACAHPNWDMGRKISVDSATMMNKGLEVIEACWLFHTSPQQIQVVLHPQSVIHSMVEYNDGSVLAQLGNPDMRTPIAHALAWPERIDSGVDRLDLFQIARLDFEAPDLERFPCLRLAYEAIEAGGTAPTVLNAANEVAVQAFLEGRLGFLGIPTLVERTLNALEVRPADSLELLLDQDRQARVFAEQAL
ncbi:MAG: 1-deoxy-D-xylulose 5-phosphate reductoisomerase [Gammaproteobacteria bacterium (ex Lamellibrachia satsuma)]|nr:MAG: 1-deoxy-D-xylulose-5-phosphate reductoisomerase [Gammaproteobacteria bacterium (ex Lamellibrachia satsuma)]RRS30502.1 MAG: 1-deoxy-D-xylulose 5-phosphate reductoisomerase [Gammaproteobacteria bacterium (ex Lamellibrachia satsuma)]RRS36863.1 MAG: 1-deoxy-D-xylulose 5-phosphate reductoisomerase [Gammaproteobacteria bacterium (ex Lamellibrachia satsuma)]